MPPERSWVRGRAWRLGEGEPSATDVSGGIDINGFIGQEKRENPADTRLEMEVINQFGSGGLDDYKPSRTNMARMKLEGQLNVVEYSRITVPESVHMGDHTGGYLEMVKNEKIRERAPYLKELITGSNLMRK